MVYVVERYLSGLNRSDLLSGLSRLEPMRAGTGAGADVRYLGSTIVLRDEACFCQFDGPSSDAVAEVNRRAGLPFNRIVPAVTVHPKGAEMSAYPSIPATVQIKRTNLLGLFAAIAVLAAAIASAVTAVAFNADATPRGKSAAQVAVPASTGIPPAGFMNGITDTATVVPVEPQAASIRLTPAAAKSIGAYLFGTANSLTPAQRQQVRDYWLGASMRMTPAEVKSIATFLFGASVPLDRARLQAVRNYWVGASQTASPAQQGGLTPAQVQSIATYLFGHSTSLTPAERRTILDYSIGAFSESR
jgi:hypothetical protein